MQSIPIKTYMIIYLSALLLLSTFILRQPIRLLVALGIIALYVAADLGLTYWKTRQLYVPSSSIISGLILSLIFDTASHPYLALLAPLLAVASKHLLKFGRVRHLMNPAAAAAVAISVFVPVVAWWGPGWGMLPLVIIVFSGPYILKRIRRYPTAFAFIISYLVILVGVSALRGQAAVLPTLVSALLLDGTLLFFASVMLIEPMTTNYPRPKDRLLFGIFVGCLAAILSLLPRFWPLRAMDPLLLALVVGNIVVGFKTLKPHVPKT